MAKRKLVREETAERLPARNAQARRGAAKRKRPARRGALAEQRRQNRASHGERKRWGSGQGETVHSGAERHLAEPVDRKANALQKGGRHEADQLSKPKR